MPVYVGRITIDQVVLTSILDGLLEILVLENEVFIAQQLLQPSHLIDNLGDIGGGEALRFAAKRDIELALSVEPNHAIETCAVEKEKI